MEFFAKIRSIGCKTDQLSNEQDSPEPKCDRPIRVSRVVSLFLRGRSSWKSFAWPIGRRGATPSPGRWCACTPLLRCELRSERKNVIIHPSSVVPSSSSLIVGPHCPRSLSLHLWISLWIAMAFSLLFYGQNSIHCFSSTRFSCSLERNESPISSV